MIYVVTTPFDYNVNNHLYNTRIIIHTTYYPIPPDELSRQCELVELMMIERK